MGELTAARTGHVGPSTTPHCAATRLMVADASSNRKRTSASVAHGTQPPQSTGPVEAQRAQQLHAGRPLLLDRLLPQMLCVERSRQELLPGVYLPAYVGHQDLNLLRLCLAIRNQRLKQLLDGSYLVHGVVAGPSSCGDGGLDMAAPPLGLSGKGLEQELVVAQLRDAPGGRE